MIRLRFCLILASVLMLPLTAALPVQAGSNPYCPKCGGGSDSPQAQYQQYRSSTEQQGSDSSGKIFLTPGSSSSGNGNGAQPFYLQGILNNPTSSRYGMHYSVSTPPQPFSMNNGAGDAQKYPTVADLQAMAQKDQEANLKSALAESAERTRQVREMQESWAKQVQAQKTKMQNTAASGASPDKSGEQASDVKYIYKKGNPTKVSAPTRVFLDNR